MKKLLFILAAGLLSMPLWAADQCTPRETAVIDSEVRCVKDTGISIGRDPDEEGAKVACMQDQKVKETCGADGRITRLRAYTEWYGKLKRFEEACASNGGAFAFQDSGFIEPQNESYCLQAVPEVSNSMFEEPLCNYRSLCPAVTVVCDNPCRGTTVAQLF